MSPQNYENWLHIQLEPGDALTHAFYPTPKKKHGVWIDPIMDAENIISARMTEQQKDDAQDEYLRKHGIY